MNLEEIKRLVQQIRGLMDSPRRQFQEARLAREYTEVCNKVNLRLQQVNTLLQGEDVLKALQLTEAKPGLLELISVLEFEGAPRWRKLCDERGYPSPPRFSDDHVSRVTEEYTREVDVHHPLYREYRKAEMQGKDVRALVILRLIHRIAPDDRGASSEAARLERKISAKRLAILREAVGGGDHDTVCRLVDELESLEFSLGGDLPLWQKAQAIRIQAGLKKIREWKEKKEWRDVRDEAAFLENLRSRFQVELDRETSRELTDATEWAKDAEEAHREERRFQKALGDLQHLLNVCEEKYLSVRKRPLAELRFDYELLARKWQEVQRYERTLDEEVEERFDKYYRLLRYQVRQRERNNMLVYAGCAVAFVAILVVAVLLVQAHRRAIELSEQLDRLGRGRQVVATEQYLTLISTNDAKLTNIPTLSRAIESAEQFVAREHSRRDLALQKIDWLLQQSENRFIELAPEQYQQRLAEVEEVGTSLAEDYQDDLAEKVTLFRANWDGFLFDEKKARTERFEKELVALEEVAEKQLGNNQPVNTVEKGLQAIETRLPVLDALASPALDVLKVSEQVLFRYQALRQRFDLMKGKVEEWQSIAKQLKNPESLSAYVGSLGSFQSNDFANPNQLRKAREITTLRPTNEKLVESLVTFESAALRDAVTSGPQPRFQPESFSGAERRLMDSLNSDPYLHEVKRFELTEVARKDGDPLKKREVYVRGQLERDKFGRLKGMVYDPSTSADAMNFEEKQFAPADFELLDLGDLKEFAFFKDSGLAKVTDGSADNLSASLLSIADRLHRETTLTPAFRVYVLHKLVLMADARPAEWAWVWAPSAKGLLRQLDELGAGEVKSGDWLVPRRNTEVSERLKPYFTKAAALDLTREVDFLFQLTQRAARDGFEFVGYVDPEKLLPSAVSKAPANQVDLWGWSGETKKPARLFEFDADAGAFKAVRTPLAFSPLFIVPADREKTIRIAADSVGYNTDSMNRSILPRLFTEQ